MRKIFSSGSSPAGVDEAKGSALFVFERMSNFRALALAKGW
jgi:hypothetical protein